MIDWSKFNLAKQAFQTCETDGEEGLTWDEVDSCEVRVCKIACPSFSTYKCGKNNYDSENWALSFSLIINHKGNAVEIQYSAFLFMLKTSTFLF